MAMNDPESFKKEISQIDLILNTISANHNLGEYLPLLKRDGAIVQLGLAMAPHPISQVPLMMKRLKVSGSAVGGIESTKEMIKLCAEKNIQPDIELVEASKIEWAYDQLADNKDATRYVIDVEKSLENKEFLP